jgi:hypothetical protein
MIPKIIHYGWFGDQSKKPIERINNWKTILKDYEFKEWNETNVDLDEYKFSKSLYELEKYGPAFDLYRTSFLYEYGGIWLDTDVIIYEDLEPFLDYSFFIGYEGPGALNLGTIGVEPKHPIFKKAKEWFHYYTDNITVNRYNYLNLIMCRINCGNAMLSAMKYLYSFTPNNKAITIGDRVRIEEVPTFTLAGNYGVKNYAEHLYEGSWRPEIKLDYADMLRKGWEKKISPFCALKEYIK